MQLYSVSTFQTKSILLLNSCFKIIGNVFLKPSFLFLFPLWFWFCLVLKLDILFYDTNTSRSYFSYSMASLFFLLFGLGSCCLSSPSTASFYFLFYSSLLWIWYDPFCLVVCHFWFDFENKQAKQYNNNTTTTKKEHFKQFHERLWVLCEFIFMSICLCVCVCFYVCVFISMCVSFTLFFHSLMSFVSLFLSQFCLIFISLKYY